MVTNIALLNARGKGRTDMDNSLLVLLGTAATVGFALFAC
jgi:hypothetical protein